MHTQTIPALTPQPQGITALRPVPTYTAWWTEAHRCEKLAQSFYICVRATNPYSLNCQWGSMIVCHKLCRTVWPSRVHRTESVSVMGHAWSAAVCSTGSDQRQQSFFVHISLFWHDTPWVKNLTVLIVRNSCIWKHRKAYHIINPFSWTDWWVSWCPGLRAPVKIQSGVSDTPRILFGLPCDL